MAAKGKWQGEPATDKQISYALTLITTRLKNANRMDEYNASKKVLDEKLTPQGNLLTKEYISRMINKLKEMPYFSEHAIIPTAAAAKAKPEAKEAIKIKEGMWKISYPDHPDQTRIFKVQMAVYGSGRLYAKELKLVWAGTLIELSEPELEAMKDPDVAKDYHKGGKYEGQVKGKFVKITGGVRILQEAGSAVSPLVKEEAVQYGQLYGVCCLCGRLLTDEKSIAAGIGPICANKAGW